MQRRTRLYFVSFPSVILQAVLCVAIAPGDQVFAVGTKNCQLKLFEMDTGKVCSTSTRPGS